MKRLYAALVLLAAVAPPAVAAELLVGAAASLQDALQEIGPAYSVATAGPGKIAFSFGASSAIARQALSHAPFDVVIMADEASMDQLAAAHLLAEGSRRDIAGNDLVLIVPRAAKGRPKLEIAGPEDLKQDSVRHLALCDKAVPVGHYAHALLAKLGMEAVLQPKVVNPENVRATLALVASGAADAGFVYRSDVATAKDKVIIVYSAPADPDLPIRYPAAVLAASKHQAEAAAFVAYLAAGPASKILMAHGFKHL